jgi:hypothetical protein
MALLWQRVAHAEQFGIPQSLPQLAGLATTAFPFWKMKTSLGQNSTQRGFPVLAQPSHLSEKIIGNHGPFVVTKLFPVLLGFF